MATEQPITIYDLEQKDPIRIKQERDMLAQAIVEMGINAGVVSKDALITGPHLLMACQDVLKSNPIIALCGAGHHFAALQDHPQDDSGKARCPHCLLQGLDVARARIKALGSC